MLKLLILATLLTLLGRMLTDVWRHWLRARLGPPVNRREPPATELVPCERCGVYAPAPRASLPGVAFLCRRCRASAA